MDTVLSRNNLLKRKAQNPVQVKDESPEKTSKLSEDEQQLVDAMVSEITDANLSKASLQRLIGLSKTSRMDQLI